MIVVIGNEKGGTGKSSIAQNLAYRLMTGSKSRKLSVQLVDTDTTSTSSQWVDRRAHLEIEPKVEVMRALRDPTPAIIRSSDAYDAVVVDVGARSYDQFSQLARIADIWIAPVQVGQGDIDSAASMYTALRRFDSQHKSGKVPLCFVFTRVPTSSTSVEEGDAREYLLSIAPDMPLLKASLKERKVWRDAQRVGRSIFEMSRRDGEKACTDFNAFLGEALKYKSVEGA
ncbi:division plane positioning ATPase MipZ [Ottowia sp.]|uniref:nucleotide-binding protein n=1 Tax=Ottowia sp. TaxID=1898956 RepID=UPI0025E85DBC|nr:division plane positioning ATPase MipZ [Ottowia sp.]MBK6616209.1 chromosome partitioning ATPase-like protein [Ottowia sp.]